MKYFSMFSGVGGFDLALNRLGHQCVGYSEIDAAAIRTYKKNFGDGIQNYGDAKQINTTTLPEFDILCGGFPCQSFSVAGRRKGFEDSRGTLFFELARIAESKRPRYLFLENVKGLLNHDQGKTFRIILQALSELGYHVEWGVCNSRYFGVPQNRERVFIIGCLRGQPRTQVFPFPITATENHGEIASTAIDANYGKGIDNHGARTGIIQLNQPTHSNDRVYSPQGTSPTLNAMQGGMRQPFIRVREATQLGYAEANIGDSINLTAINSLTRRGCVGKGVAQTIDTGMQQYTIDYRNTRQMSVSPTLLGNDHNTIHMVSDEVSIRRLTPRECEKLQGFPPTWTAGESDTARYKMMGNAVTVNVISFLAKRFLGEVTE